MMLQRSPSFKDKEYGYGNNFSYFKEYFYYEIQIFKLSYTYAYFRAY